MGHGANQFSYFYYTGKSATTSNQTLDGITIYRLSGGIMNGSRTDSNATCTFNLYSRVTKTEYNYSKGTEFIENVTSPSESSYPNDGYKNGYYYKKTNPM